MSNRRLFFTGLGALLAAPAVVRASSLMPVRGVVMPIARFSAPAWFNEYDTQMWNKLMQIGRVKEHMGLPLGRKIAEAMRTCTLPWSLRRDHHLHIPPDVKFDWRRRRTV